MDRRRNVTVAVKKQLQMFAIECDVWSVLTSVCYQTAQRQRISATDFHRLAGAAP